MGKFHLRPSCYQGNKESDNNDGDWMAKKRKAPQLEQKQTIEYGHRLHTVLSHPQQCINQWKEVQSEIEATNLQGTGSLHLWNYIAVVISLLIMLVANLP